MNIGDKVIITWTNGKEDNILNVGDIGTIYFIGSGCFNAKFDNLNQYFSINNRMNVWLKYKNLKQYLRVVKLERILK